MTCDRRSNVNDRKETDSRTYPFAHTVVLVLHHRNGELAPKLVHENVTQDMKFYRNETRALARKAIAIQAQADLRCTCQRSADVRGTTRMYTRPLHTHTFQLCPRRGIDNRTDTLTDPRIGFPSASNQEESARTSQPTNRIGIEGLRWVSWEELALTSDRVSQTERSTARSRVPEAPEARHTHLR